MRQVKALARSVALLAVAIACPFVFVWVIAGVSLVLSGPAVLKSVRRFTNLARRLSGVSTEAVYRAPLPPPEPDEDGLYKVGERLVDKPSWWNEFDRRLEWIGDDPASHRDVTWLVTNLFVGTALAALAPGLIGLGIWSLVTPWWVASIPLVLAGFFAAPYLVGLHDRWTAVLLEPKSDGRMFQFWVKFRLHFEKFGYVAANWLMALAGVVLGAGSLIVGAPVHLWGLWIVAWVPIMLLNRELTSRRRHLVGSWSGILIASPYLPQPVPPAPRPDGMYRHGRQLYKTPKAMLRGARYRWVMTDVATWRDLASAAVDFLVGLAAVPAAIFLPGPVLRLQAKVSRWLLAPTAKALLAHRVEQLTATRADATDAQAAELRRIERDLHDGAQARLVALGLHLGAVERLIDQDPEAAKSLVAKTKAASAEALTELRDLVRGIHPPVLAERGLGDAIRALALDSPLKVTVEGSLAVRPAAPVESAVYFAVCELLVNAAKHADAKNVIIHMRHDPGVLSVSVIDDGRGGASTHAGTGLRGLHRRLATFDGTFELVSPVGGPTVATVRIPSS
ncbi:signal transduction histidine kinase [Kibdelosporangium banguiense]|uniref:histidine kinase n=1 Tax=Kibdelosporangium banguiense TaxID=1365924 RepID=A0ABS4T9A1_9PSEU|nr:histidine kinase [Kibdelosporangium banguiense]MBP2320995.1 signal transduction histidine kinase [Kibdelosporangium banguiense]